MSNETQDRPEIADEVVDRAEIRAGHVIVEYTRTEAALADLRSRYAGATFDLSTTAGDKAARAARLELKTLRTSLEARRKEFKAPALDFGQKIDAEAKRITAEIVALESPIDEQIKAEEQRREAERAAKAEAERQRVADIQQKIARIAAVAVRAVGLNAEAIDAKRSLVLAVPIGDDYAEFRADAETVKAETLATLASMHAAALAAEAEAARLKAEQEAEAERLAAERAEQQRIAAEQAARQAQLEAEANRIAEEQAKQAAQRQRDERLAAERKARIDARIEQLQDALTAASGDTSQQIAALRQRILSTEPSEDLFGDRMGEAVALRSQVLIALGEQQEAAAKREADLAIAAAKKNIEEQQPQQVLKAEPATADATDRGIAATTSPVGGPMGAGQAAAAAPTADDPATLKLGTICERLGFTVTAAFLADVLRIQHAATDKRVMLYRESQWPLICAQLLEHVGAVCELYAVDALTVDLFAEQHAWDFGTER